MKGRFYRVLEQNRNKSIIHLYRFLVKLVAILVFTLLVFNMYSFYLIKNVKDPKNYATMLNGNVQSFETVDWEVAKEYSNSKR